MLPIVLKLADKVKVPGESMLKGYEGQIDVAHIDHGVLMPLIADKSSNSRTSGRCLHQDFVCLMRLNKAYPKLIETCAKGANLGAAEITLVKMSEGKISEVAKYTLKQVYISSVALVEAPEQAASRYGGSNAAVSAATNESGDTSLPWFKVSLNYQSIAVTYNEYDSSGASKGAVSCPELTGLGA